MKYKSRFSFIIFMFTMIFFYIPLVMLVIFSFNSGKSMTWQGFSLKWYQELFFNSKDQLWSSFWNTMLIGITSSIIATVVGTLGAIGLFWYNFKHKKYLQVSTYLPIIIPEIIIGVALVILFAGFDVSKTFAFLGSFPEVKLELVNYFINFKFSIIDSVFRFKMSMPLSLFTVFLSHVTFATPFVMFIIMSRLEEFDYSIVEAAYDLGAQEIDALLKVIIPVTMPGIISGFLMAMTLSLDDFVITSFVSGPGASTLPIYISNTIKRGAVPVLNSLSVVLIVMSVFLALISKRFQKYMFK